MSKTEFAKVARDGPAALREELRSWLEEHRLAELDGLDGFRLYEYDGDGIPTMADEYGEAVALGYRAWEADLMEVNLVCPHWDVEFGGLGFGPVEMAVVNLEFARARMPRVLRGMGEIMFGPSLMIHGTREQQQRYLPRIITGEDRWCQGFSEPDSGSDLASLKTRATRDGDQLVINGQKVWTSGATRANMMFLLCRTDPDVPRHRGISYVVLPMDSPGIEVRPIRQISGTSEFCETFFSDVRTSIDNVVGSLGAGWQIANSTLSNERGNLFTEWCIQFDRDVEDLLTEARSQNDRSASWRLDLVDMYITNRLLGWQNDRLLEAEGLGRPAGPIEYTSKLFWSEAQTRLGEVALSVFGAASTLRPEGDGYAVSRWQDIFLWSRGLTIAAGTSEIQRTIIAERGLGLPREPRLEGR